MQLFTMSKSALAFFFFLAIIEHIIPIRNEAALMKGLWVKEKCIKSKGRLVYSSRRVLSDDRIFPIIWNRDQLLQNRTM